MLLVIYSLQGQALKISLNFSIHIIHVLFEVIGMSFL